MRNLYALLLFFVLGVSQAQQPVPIEIKGTGVKVVKVDKVVIVKEDMTLVSSLPFTVNAPAGNLLYVWSYPQGVTARKKGEILEVTAAPKGAVTVSVEMISVDFDAKKVVTKYGEVTFTVGDVPLPPIPPGPEPKPPEPKPPEPSADNPFVAAWKMETVANKENIVAVIAALYRGYASEAKIGMKTGKQLFDFMSAAYLAAKSGNEPIQGKLTKLVPVVNQWIASTLKVPEGQLTAEDRTAAHATFIKIANWLGELK